MMCSTVRGLIGLPTSPTLSRPLKAGAAPAPRIASPRKFQYAGQRLGRFGIEMDRPALATLGPVNMRLPIGQLDIAASEGAQLGNAHAGPKEHQDDRPHLEGTELLDLVLVPLQLADIFDNPLEVAQLHVRRRRCVKRGIIAAIRTRSRSVERVGCRS